MSNSSNESNRNVEINDLESNCAEEIKGGPKRIFIGGLSAQETQTMMADLEPMGEIKGGPGSGSSGGVWLNHNETLIADENVDDSAETARLTDLPVNNQQEEEVKGGLLLPAVQKVREAAARMQTGVGSSGMSAGKVSYSDLS